MRRIRKTNPPQQFRQWLVDNAVLNHTYGDLIGTDAHKALKAQLLEEQGKICAYTGMRINDSISHVEHMKPQNKCDDGGGEDVDYRNVVACFPADGGDKSYGFGAPIKAGWWEEDSFISPIFEECERRFSFSWSGKISPVPENHEGATTTIHVVGLDKEELRQLRRARINGFFGFGVRTKGKPLSVREAQVALQNIDQSDGQGQLSEFCFVLKQLLPKYINGGGA